MTTVSPSQSGQSTPTSNLSEIRPPTFPIQNPPYNQTSARIHPLTISALDDLNAIRIERVPESPKKLGIFSRYPDGRRVLIKEVTGTDLEKAWETLKASHQNVSSDFRIDLSESRLEFQDSANQTHRINLYKDNLEPIYKAISKLTISYEVDGKTKERDLSEFINLPTHLNGRRAASQAKAGLQKDDPRLQILKFEKKEMIQILDREPLDEAGLKTKIDILKRKKAAKDLVEQYQQNLKTMQETANLQKSLAGQSQIVRVSQMIKKPLDLAAIGFNAVYPFPVFSNIDEFHKALESQLTKAKEFIESHPKPSKVNSAKEELYAKELVLAGLPDSHQGADERQIYERGLAYFKIKPTRDTQEAAFIRLAHQIAKADLNGIKSVVESPSFEVLLEPLNLEEKAELQKKFSQTAQELVEAFESPSLRNPENSFGPQLNSNRLIDEFVREVDGFLLQKRNPAPPNPT